MDDLDRRLIALLRDDGRATVASLAKRLGWPAARSRTASPASRRMA